MKKLGVNVDHIATIRQARRIDEPDPVFAAFLAEQAGANSIVCHLREDRRHIQDMDLELLRKTVKTRLNLEMAPVEEMVRIALNVHPDQVTLVPERREEITTEGGLDVVSLFNSLQSKVKILKEAGIVVSLFIDPDPEQVKASHKIGADAIELHTGRYAEAKKPELMREEWEKIRDMAKLGRKLGLVVHAGHGLNYRNVQQIAAIDEIEELNIGHSIVVRAVFVGFEKAVKDMLTLISSPHTVF